jgi:predicted hotdog family 3-hydroxylacyl-ACP dehydratase
MKRSEFEHLIPHTGAMCLLEELLEWDSARIRCRASSHRDATHPLAENGRLHAVCGVEYAAQAVALHGALVGAAAGASSATPGYLAGIRRLALSRERLDDVPGDLIIDARCQLADAGGLIYDFAVGTCGERLLEGRLSILLAVPVSEPS